MINNWKTLDQIGQAYNLKSGALNKWIQECKQSPYANAIVRPSGSRTYIKEDLWQKFLEWKSDKRNEKLLDPHYRKVRSA